MITDDSSSNNTEQDAEQLSFQARLREAMLSNPLVSEVRLPKPEAGEVTALVRAARTLISMNNCNYDRDAMRYQGAFAELEKAVIDVEQKGEIR